MHEVQEAFSNLRQLIQEASRKNVDTCRWVSSQHLVGFVAAGFQSRCGPRCFVACPCQGDAALAAIKLETWGQGRRTVADSGFEVLRMKLAVLNCFADAGDSVPFRMFSWANMPSPRCHDLEHG